MAKRAYRVSLVNGYEEGPFECDGYNAAMNYAERKQALGFHVVVEELSEEYRKVAEFNKPKAPPFKE